MVRIFCKPEITPEVELANEVLTVVSYNNTQIVVDLPTDVIDGDYLLLFTLPLSIINTACMI